MKRVMMLAVACMLTFGTPAISVYANSLDDIVNEETADTTDSSADNSNSSDQTSTSSEYVTANDAYINNIKEATTLSEPSAGATKVNEGIKKVASFIVQILSYFVTALLVVRVLLDLTYITLPFMRSALANGYQGNGAATGNTGMGMQGGMGMGGGMSMGGMGGYGMNRGMGMGGYGMGGGMGMNRGMGGMQGASPSTGRTQWVSNAALNAVAAESCVGNDGKAVSPLKMYAKDMFIVLIITPVLLLLAITGTLTNLGFMIGDLIVSMVNGIGSML
jgi:hypothetical protein